MTKAFILIFTILAIGSSVYADESSNEKRNENEKPNFGRVIPYPGQSIYVEKGMVGGLGFGHNTPSGQDYDPELMFQWEGEGSFYYFPFISGGVKARIVSGSPRDDRHQIENIFQVFSRLHKRMGNVAMFAGPGVGFHILDYKEDFLRGQDTVPKTFTHYHPQLVFETGIGWAFSSFLGVAFGVKGTYVWFYEAVVQESFVITVPMNRWWGHSAAQTKEFFLSLEVQYWQIWDYRFPRREREVSTIFGMGVAF